LQFIKKSNVNEFAICTISNKNMAKVEDKKIKALVIVESPAKAKTIEKFLGTGYVVASSIGHIRDLPKKDMSIDIKNGFLPTYEITADKKKTVAELKKLVKDSQTVLLATDEDREGEAIAWHLLEALNLDATKTKRIVFHEITKSAITKAVQNPRDLDLNLVNAQQARRVLDRLVGYELSPVLWRKVQRGLSAGRVQSVAVRLVVDREREIDGFQQEFSFRILAEFVTKDGKKLTAELKTRFKTFEDAEKFLQSIQNSNFKVSDIVIRPGKKSPSAPFTTSTLQQEASRKLSFSVKQTMMVAQKLYESGKITYMRTDSLNLSETALDQAKDVINSNYGQKYLNIRHYKTKDQSAQEAHEAIRPTDLSASAIKADKDQMRLYELIWKRTVASQMADAILEKTTAAISISNSKELFMASGEVIKFDGFLTLYMESSDDDFEDETSDKLLPKMNKEDVLDYNIITGRQVFKNPPPRYNEASLVKKLEEMGIGRPSTYAPTISTVQDRGYVVKEDREGRQRFYKFLVLSKTLLNIEEKSEIIGTEKSKLFPTDMGIVVNDFLVKNFPEIVDFNFTAKVESEFDEIANGNKVWNEMIADFYTPFKLTLQKSDDIKRQDAVQSRELGIDPKSGKPIFAKIGRYGPMFQLGETDDVDKPKFASIPKNVRFEHATIDEAIKMFELPRIIGITQGGEEVSTQVGRFGPYIKCGKTFVSIKEDEIFTLTLEECIERVDNKAAVKIDNTIKVFKENERIKVLNGRYGPYITDGKKNVKIPKDKAPADLKYAECLKLIGEAPAKKASPRKKKTT
jgi:DNA topoisomerase-1